MDFKQLNKRQELILALIGEQENSSVSEIILEMSVQFKDISRITIIRDLNYLIGLDFIERFGKGRAVVYKLSLKFNLLKPIDTDKYFKISPDKRKSRSKFNFDLLNNFKNIFNKDEKKYLADFLIKYKKNIKKISKDILKSEFERLTIELSWKSSSIEGNTYTLLETESLIRYGKKAKGHKKAEAEMILNHKIALDYIRKNFNSFKNISISKIEDIHCLLMKNLGIKLGLRKLPVGITGTIYRPLDNIYQIREALEFACKIVNKEKDVFSKALILILIISYIQPFNDGNKRTSRFSANAILMAYNICPLSYRSVDEGEYKKAMILFYEQNNLSYFKKIFIEQFEFATKNYFLV